MNFKSIGVCIFENINAPEIAYVSIGGEESSKIFGINELPSDVLWVTNLPYKQYKSARVYNMSYIKQNQYFRTSTDIMLRELGIENADLATQSRILSDIFNRVNRLSNLYFGYNALEYGTDYRFANELRNFTYPDILKKNENTEMYSLAYEASKQATQSHQAMAGVSAPRGSTTYNFYFPRTEFVKYIMNLPLPIRNDWREITFKSGEIDMGTYEGKKIKGTEDVINKFIEMSKTRAVLFRVSVKYIDPKYRPFQTFSAGLKTTRSWASLPEVIELSRYSRITISGGVSCELGNLNVLDKCFDDIGIEYSYSRGILLENAFTSLSVGWGDMKENFLSAYLRSYDRILCSKAALSFSENGFTVGSFGTGRITVYLTRGEVETANILARKIGLMTSIKKIKDDI